MSLHLDIAKAIRKADSSYFFEDYTKQATAVLRALEKKGYTVVPKKATDEMLEAGTDAIMPGNVRPELHVQYVFEAMLSAGSRK